MLLSVINLPSEIDIAELGQASTQALHPMHFSECHLISGK
jgi:hypothetical protein